MLHAASISLLLDEMMNYVGGRVFESGPHAAFVVELMVRYKRPVSLLGAVTVRTWVEEREQEEEVVAERLGGGWGRECVRGGEEFVFGRLEGTLSCSG
jgi:acyl-CoA thioesterase FadM